MEVKLKGMKNTSTPLSKLVRTIISTFSFTEYLQIILNFKSDTRNKWWRPRNLKPKKSMNL